MKFENVYWDSQWLANDNKSASILAIGDSWFWYPFPGGSLLNALGPIVATREHTLLAFGNNGAEAFDYVDGVYRTQVETGLRMHGAGLSAVFISGGGNDFAGYNDLRPLLNLDCSAAADAPGCFKPGNAAGTIDALMQRTQLELDRLIAKVFAAARAGTEVFLHNYDYAYPTGKGIFGGDSGWLEPALDDARVPAGLQRPCVIYLIDRLTAVIDTLAAKYPNRVFAIDSRNTLAQADWANELHPKPDGFQRIAQQRWRPVLVSRGLATA